MSTLAETRNAVLLCMLEELCVIHAKSAMGQRQGIQFPGKANDDPASAPLPQSISAQGSLPKHTELCAFVGMAAPQPSKAGIRVSTTQFSASIRRNRTGRTIKREVDPRWQI